MRAFRKVISIVAVIAVVAYLFVSCQKKEHETLNYNFNTDFIGCDGSVPLLNSENCERLLKNPDRGLRMENYITLGEVPDTYPLSGENPFEVSQQTIEKYKADSPTLCQLYVYLSDYSKKDLDETAFTQLREILELYRENGIRVLLRFAYSTESVKDAPYRIVKRHLEQLKAFFAENSQLINDTLYCLQTGIIGYWGEGHSNKKLRNRYIDDVINGVCELAPEGIYTQVRTLDMYNKVSTENIGKVGIHDDYIIGDMSHMWSYVPSGDAEAFQNTIQRAKLTVNDGEMPWGRARLDDLPDGEPLDSLDGKAVLKQLAVYSMTSFSLEHNYIENGNENSMAKWKSQYLTYDEVTAMGVSVNPALFRNAEGEKIGLSVYDIIRYHLGYQLVLSNYKTREGKVSFSVTNYGFAAPLNFNYMAVAFRNNETGEIIKVQIKDYDKRELQSGTSVMYSAEVPESCSALGVILDTFEGRGVNIAFANDTPFIGGIQYFAG